MTFAFDNVPETVQSPADKIQIDMFDNISSQTMDQVSWIPGSQTIACIFYTVILFVGIIGNTLVIVIVVRYRDMRNATNMLLTNLSVADLFLLLFCTPDGYQHLYGKDKHRLGKFMCSFSPFVQNATATCSILTIMAISYERYVAICQPLKTSSLRLALFRTVPTVVFFWLISCLISVPFYAYTHTDLANATYGETIVTCETRFPARWSNWYLIVCTVCIHLIILIMLCYWHFSICSMLFNREALLRDNTIVTRYRRQVALLLIALIITFFILVLPHKIWAIIHHQMTYQDLYELGFRRHSILMIITRSLLYLNSAINPLLYSIMSTKFRQSVVLLCGGCRGSSGTPRSAAVFFCKQYAMRQMLMNANGAGTMSTTPKMSQQQPTGQLIEKKALLAENTPTPAMTAAIDDTKFLFP